MVIYRPTLSVFFFFSLLICIEAFWIIYTIILPAGRFLDFNLLILKYKVSEQSTEVSRSWTWNISSSKLSLKSTGRIDNLICLYTSTREKKKKADKVGLWIIISMNLIPALDLGLTQTKIFEQNTKHSCWMNFKLMELMLDLVLLIILTELISLS